MAERQEQPANGREMQIIEYLAALDAQLTGHQDALRKRLKLVPNGWRQWRLMTVTTGALLSSLYDTLPLKSLKHMENLCRNGEVLVRIKPIARQPGQIVADEDDLREIINAAMASECALCLRGEKEVKSCKLRRAMMEIIPPEDIPLYGCPYRDITINSEYGKYI